MASSPPKKRIRKPADPDNTKLYDPYAYGWEKGRGLILPDWWNFKWENGKNPSVYEMLRGWCDGYQEYVESEKVVEETLALRQRQADRHVKETFEGGIV